MPAASGPGESGVRFRLLWKVSQFTRRHRWKRAGGLLRLAYSPRKRQHDHLELAIDYDAGLSIYVDTASLIEWQLFFFGTYEPEITGLMRRLVRPGCVALDVGANIGCHTLVMAQQAGPTGMVVAYEPHPAVRERLTRNINLNHLGNVVINSCALSSEAGKAVLYGFGKDDPNQGISSFYHAHAGFAATPEEMSVEVATLDATLQHLHLDRLDLLKVDTEGNEVRVLQGGLDSIRRYRPSIIFEYADENWADAGTSWELAARLLGALGYEFYDVWPQYLTRIGEGLRPRTHNILAVPAMQVPVPVASLGLAVA